MKFIGRINKIEHSQNENLLFLFTAHRHSLAWHESENCGENPDNFDSVYRHDGNATQLFDTVISSSRNINVTVTASKETWVHFLAYCSSSLIACKN